MRYLSRAQWGCTTPLGPKMKLPVSTIFIHHSVTKATNNPVADMRALDRIGRQRFGRFSYSYVIHPNGTVMEGAGDRVGAHTGGYNSTSIGVCFIGNYEEHGGTLQQVAGFIDLVRMLQARGHVTRNVNIRAHRDVKATACPGRHLVAGIPALRKALAGGAGAGSPAPAPAPSEHPLVKLKRAIDAAKRHTLRRGDRGQHVQALQVVLIGKGATQLKPDGIFGQQTEQVVRWFQKLSGLVPDGVVGPKTWKALTS